MVGSRHMFVGNMKVINMDDVEVCQIDEDGEGEWCILLFSLTKSPGLSSYDVSLLNKRQTGGKRVTDKGKVRFTKETTASNRCFSCRNIKQGQDGV